MGTAAADDATAWFDRWVDTYDADRRILVPQPNREPVPLLRFDAVREPILAADENMQRRLRLAVYLGELRRLLPFESPHLERRPDEVPLRGAKSELVLLRKRRPMFSRTRSLSATERGDLVAGFERETGIPVLVNTSFNVHEEPIVNTPRECAQALLDKRIDFVVTNQAIYEAA